MPVDNINSLNKSHISPVSKKQPQIVSFGQKQAAGDEFVNNNPKKHKNKWLLWAGIGLATITTAIVCARHFSPLKQIERRFKKLYDNIPGTQKKFKEVFLREDLTEEETIQMLKRYEKIEKDGLKQSKEEYWQAVFNEAKANYKFDEDFNGITLVIDDKIERSSAGFWRKKDKTVHIRPGVRKKFGLGCIHHELRHAKQDELLKYCTEEDLINMYGKSTYQSLKKFSSIGNKTEEEYIRETFYGDDDFSRAMRNSIKDIFRTITDRNDYLSVEELSKVPKEKLEIAKKFLHSKIDYTSAEKDFLKYWDNFTELDARKTENTINEMITGINTKYREKLVNNKWIRKILDNLKEEEKSDEILDTIADILCDL